MKAATWVRVRKLFHEAIELAPWARSAFLDTRCDGEGELRVQVERLLREDDAPGEFLAGGPPVLDPEAASLRRGERWTSPTTSVATWNRPLMRTARRRLNMTLATG